jgi:hypothetical protein
MVRLSREERESRLGELRAVVNDWPVIPVFKDEESLRASLLNGNMDCIVDAMFWKGGRGAYHGVLGRFKITPVKPWCSATAGFSIREWSVGNALEAVNALIDEQGVEHRFIYLRIVTPDMPYPRMSYVDSAMRHYAALEAALERGELPGDLYDL